MSDWVTKYTCGSCAEYTYEGKNRKGYCARYKTYYFPDDHCDHWEESSNVSSGSSGCFITTACCSRHGLADDCALLTKLRALRDDYLLVQPEGRALVEDYYRTAPAIVTAVNARSDADTVYDRVYSVLLEIASLIDDGKNEEAVARYRGMTEDLRMLVAGII